MSEEEIRRQREEERRRRIELIALLALLYTNMEDEMLSVIAENLGTDDFDGDLDSWRMRHLAAAENVGRTVTRIAGSYAAAQEQVFSEAITGAAREEAARVDFAVGASAASSAASSAAASVSVSAGSSAKTASRVSEYFRKQAKHDINTVNTVMKYKAKQGYVTAVNSAFFNAKQSERIWKALGEGAFDVAAGRASLQSAVRSAIAKMSEKGIPAFIDKAGREWSPEAYVRMDIRTTAANTARQAQWERCKEHGINLIEVSAHAGARPLCAPYQGGIYSLDGSSGAVKDAAGREINFTPLSSTSYGQAAGLFGINCGHQSYPFKPGINFRRFYPLETDEEFAENSKRYAEFQKQRAMERSIRASKRECMMCDAAGDKDGFTKASQKLARRKQAYREYSKSVGLKQHNDRTQVYGFDRSVSGKVTWANKKAKLTANSDNLLKAPSIVVDKSTKSGYNLNIQDSVSNAKYYLDSKPKNKCAEVLRSQLDQAELEARTLKDVPYAISKSNHKIYFDPDNPYFSDYNPTISILHETAHRADLTLYHAAENEEFSQAILDTVMNTDRGKLAEAYNALSPGLRDNGYLSDIMSAVTENDGRFILSSTHDNEYWLEAGNKESEIFANLFTLEAVSETEAIYFVKNNLPILYSSFANMI